MGLPNVVGVGIGEKDNIKVIKLFVSHKVPETDLNSFEIIPQEIESYPVDVEIIGDITAQ